MEVHFWWSDVWVQCLVAESGKCCLVSWRLASRDYWEAVSSLPKQWFSSLSPSCNIINTCLQYYCKILVEAKPWHFYSKGKWIPGCYIALTWEHGEWKPTASWFGFIQRESQCTRSLLWETPHRCCQPDWCCKTRYTSVQMWQGEVISVSSNPFSATVVLLGSGCDLHPSGRAGAWVGRCAVTPAGFWGSPQVGGSGDSRSKST